MPRTKLNEETFLQAAKEGNLPLLKRHVKAELDVNCKEPGTEYFPLALAAEGNHVDCVRYLLSLEDIDVSQQTGESDDAIGGTALHIAAYRGHVEVIRLLVAHDPSLLDETEYCGFTPLQETIDRDIGENPPLEAFKLILRLKADHQAKKDGDMASTQFPDGASALSMIVKQWNDCSYEERGNRIKTYEEMYKLLVRRMLKEGIRIHEKYRRSDRLAKIYAREVKRMREFHEEDSDHKNMRGDITVEYPELETDSESDSMSSEDETNSSEEDDSADESRRDFTDSDSEEDADYAFEKSKTSRLNVNPLFESTAASEQVMSARGVHFNKSDHSSSVVQQHKTQSTANELSSRGLFSIDAHRQADISFQSHAKGTKRERDQSEVDLVESANETKRRLLSLATKSAVTPILGRNQKKLGRQEFSTRLIELIQRYVNSYRTLTDDIKKSHDQKFFRNERTKLKNDILQLFQSNPFVSTSEDLGVALSYATAILNYDNKDTHQPSAFHGDTRTPQYSTDGDLKFPYLGVVFVTLHTREDIIESSENILELYAKNEIDPIKGPGTHETSGHIRAQERIFFGGIDRHHVFCAKIIRMPNLFHPWRSFTEEKYGLDEKTYTKFRNDLKKFGFSSATATTMRNPKAFHRTEEQIIKHVIDLETAKMTREIQALAAEKGLAIGSLDLDHNFHEILNGREKITAAVQRRNSLKM